MSIEDELKKEIALLTRENQQLTHQLFDYRAAFMRARDREWVGLTTGEAREFYESDLSREELIHKIDEFLQEKNT